MSLYSEHSLKTHKKTNKANKIKVTDQTHSIEFSITKCYFRNTEVQNVVYERRNKVSKVREGKEKFNIFVASLMIKLHVRTTGNLLRVSFVSKSKKVFTEVREREVLQEELMQTYEAREIESVSVSQRQVLNEIFEAWGEIFGVKDVKSNSNEDENF